MPNQEKRQIFTGARCRFLLDGKKVGWATGVSGSEEYMYEAIDVLDNLETEEHAIVGYRCDMACSIVGIVTQSLRSLGFMPKAGTSPEEHLANVLALDGLGAVIEDNQTGKVIAEYFQVRTSRKDFQTAARGTMGINVQFVAIRSRDVAEA